jgi:hypothetical protein
VSQTARHPLVVQVWVVWRFHESVTGGMNNSKQALRKSLFASAAQRLSVWDIQPNRHYSPPCSLNTPACTSRLDLEARLIPHCSNTHHRTKPCRLSHLTSRCHTKPVTPLHFRDYPTTLSIARSSSPLSSILFSAVSIPNCSSARLTTTAIMYGSWPQFFVC